MNSFLIYIFQVSVCQMAFYLLYYFVLRKQTFFQANRAYLLFSTFISFIIPMLSFEVWSKQTTSYLSPFTFPILKDSTDANVTSNVNDNSALFNFDHLIIIILFVIYLVGALMQIIKLLLGIKKVFAILHRSNQLVRRQNIIRTEKGPAFFSFWKYIFVNDQKLFLNEQELQHIIKHENVHIHQRHTLDILFLELATMICWFNPFVYKMKQALCQTHEYIADNKVVMGNISIDHYSKLILQLCTKNGSIPLTHHFSKIDIKNRITMLNQSNTNKMKALKIFYVLPILALLIMVFSFTEKSSITSDISSSSKQEELVTGTISWEGNTKYTDEYLGEIAGLKPGSTYKTGMGKNMLKYDPEKITISDLYMDKGYLFFNVNVEEEVISGKVNLVFKVYEGQIVNVDKIIIKGNQKVGVKKVLEMIDIKKGDLFNRARLIASQKNIAESGYFKSDAVGINPIPHDDVLIDIEFVLEEL